MASKSKEQLDWQGEHWQRIDQLITTNGEDHADVADALNELGVLLCEKNAWKESELALQRALKIRRKVLSPCHPGIATIYFNLATLYERQNLFDKAESFYRNSLAIRRQFYGSYHYDTLISTRSLAWALIQQKEYRQAEEYCKHALEIHQNLTGEEDPALATSLCMIAHVYKVCGQYESSEKYYKLALSISERANGPDHPEIAWTIDLLAFNYQLRGNSEKAEELYKRALNIREESLGAHHLDTALSLDNVGNAREAQGSHHHAEHFFKRALKIRQLTLGLDHPDVAISFDKLTHINESQSNFVKAREYCEQALKIREGALAPGHPEIAENLVELAFLDTILGCHGRANLLICRALETIRNTSAAHDSGKRRTLDLVAQIAIHQCHYNKAEWYLLQLLDLNEKLTGAKSPETAKTLHTLAQLYREQGRTVLAEQFFRRALAIREEALGAGHSDVLETISGLAGLYKAERHYIKAEALWMRALDIGEQVHSFTQYNMVMILSSLASLRFAKGDQPQAQATLKRAFEATEEGLDWEPIVKASALALLGAAHTEQGLYQEAKYLLSQSLAILKQAIGDTNPITQMGYCKLAMIYLRLQRIDLALPLLDASFRSQLNWLHDQAALIERGNRRHLLAMRQGLDSFSFKSLNADYRMQVLFLFVRFNFNGLLQEIEKRQQDVSRLRGKHQPLVEQLKGLITILSSSQVNPEARRTLAARRDELEVQLYRLLPHFQIKTVEVDEVANALSENSALIEFQYIPSPPCSSGEAADRPRYLAFVLLPSAEIRMIDLGPSGELEAAIREVTDATVNCLADASAAWQALSERLLLPLLSVLNGCKVWFLSLDGELHRVPFNSLPYPGEPERLLAEIVQLQLVTTGRDLVDQYQRPDGSSAAGPSLVVADPTFDQTPGLPAQEPLCPRSRDMGVMSVWPPLPGTGMEGKQVSELLGSVLRTGAAATCLAVQEAHQPRLLHIATHGFFLFNQDDQPGDQYSLDIGGTDLLSNLRGEDPLLRSGLVFAGANHPPEDPELDDGYLTAQEAVHLDLQGTALVTLSACDTGRGEVQTGEGVYGLQRALIVAGARSLLLSLWQVPDEATCEFMVRFYTLLKQGAGRFEALVTVQREFRQHDNIVWRHPFYWGAWQLLGDGGPIEGL